MTVYVPNLRNSRKAVHLVSLDCIGRSRQAHLFVRAIRSRRVTQVAPLFCPVAEIVKQRYAISFGPDAYFTSFLEGLVIPFNGFLSIKRHREVLALKIHPQGVPLVGSHLQVGPFLFRAPTI